MNNIRGSLDDSMLYPEGRDKWAKDNFDMTFEEWQKQNPPFTQNELDEYFESVMKSADRLNK
jgi:hypothetical protein